ncbi:MAG: hypothetical protein PHI23_05045 [Candidatus Peribacteraceae bacterium]|nr:hypothetical protein [Candidatus Peribacteraceae bacterium]
MRPRHLPLALLFVFLAGCGGTKLTYKLTFDTTDPVERTTLGRASANVVERRLQRLGEEAKELKIEEKGEEAFVSVKVPNEAIGEELTRQLTTPFKLRIMLATEDDKADLLTLEYGGFKETGITEKQIKWMTASDEEGGTGRITITFTDEGRSLMKKIFQEHQGEFLGLFVRDILMSKMYIDTNELKDDIIITGVPRELAGVFADDVNSGLHVTFSLQ